MSQWMERNKLKLTHRGERVMVGLVGFGMTALCAVAFLIDGIINPSIGG